MVEVVQKFYPYDGGSSWINNEELQILGTPAWRKVIGVVPQDITVFSGTLLANICLDPGTENIEKVRQFCHLSGFDRIFESLASSYATRLWEAGVAPPVSPKQFLARAP